MAETVITGQVADAGLSYRVVLNGDPGPVATTPGLAELMPNPGDPVSTGPAGVDVEFDPDDPVAVATWLQGSTDVRTVEGPNLVDPGDLAPEGAVN
jgi:hypothetical protein